MEVEKLLTLESQTRTQTDNDEAKHTIAIMKVKILELLHMFCVKLQKLHGATNSSQFHLHHVIPASLTKPLESFKLTRKSYHCVIRLACDDNTAVV